MKRWVVRGAGWLTTTLFAVGMSGCGDNPEAPELPELEVVAASGSGQFGVVGQELAEPFHAVVRRVDTGAPRKDMSVEWTIEQGSGATWVGASVVTTDSTGSAFARLRLGPTAGTYRVRARVVEQERASASFEAVAVQPPRLLGLSPSTVSVGDTLRIEGTGFSPVAEQDVALFSGIRGRVVAASTSELRVEVPSCLPTRAVTVTVQLGVVRTGGMSLDVRGSLPPELRPLGEDEVVADPAGLRCERLPGGPGAQYLVTVVSASTIGAARHDYSLAALVSTGLSGAPGMRRAPPGAPIGGPPRGVTASVNFGERFERDLRLREKRLAPFESEGRAERAARAPRLAPVEVPAVGDRRTFKVLNASGGFDDVTAVARYVGSHAALFIDESAPAGGFTAGDLAAFDERFDDVIYPVDTGVFGEPSDLDGNERIVILFTPAVNRLTPRGSAGFVGGFFFGLDLLPDREGSNAGEIFYSLVPDPEGRFGDARVKSQLLSVTPAILAHEFMHMIHFNQRVLKLGAAGTEALWLSEGLAQMAEELVGEEYERRGKPQSAALFRAGNRTRARRFLKAPSAVSLIVTFGKGTLEERGAGWLFLMYLRGLGGGNDVLTRLTRTTRTGVDNVVSVIGTPWEPLVSDWATALYLDGLGIPTRNALDIGGIDLRATFTGSDGAYPLAPPTVGLTDFTRTGALWSSSATHFIVVPPASGSVALRLGGSSGAASSPTAALRMDVVRIR